MSLIGWGSGTGGSGAVTASGDVADGDPDSGNPVAIGGEYNATPPTYTDGDRVKAQFDASGNLKAVVAFGGTVATASITALASAATSAQLLAANTARVGLFLTNTDANRVLVKYGTTASATSFTVPIAGNGGYWEMPQPIYVGRIDAIWDADGAGSLIATEI